MKRSAFVTIHPDALQHNIKRAKAAAPNSKINAVIKANAYGHGAVETAGILYPHTNGFAVSCIPEAVELKQAHIDKPITVLQGPQTLEDLHIAAHYQLRLTLHEKNQLALLDEYSGKARFALNLKIDTGMHRLGFAPDQVAHVYQKLRHHPQVSADQLILMTHLCCADEQDNPATATQLKVFKQSCHHIKTPHSIANSAGILGWPATHADWNRPGIMLYGSSPLAKQDRDALDLRAAMTLQAPVIAIHDLKQGDCIGYGASWTCPENMQVAVIACGYADGYPRHAPSGTPVWLNEDAAQLVGRVSMDMIVVALSDQQSDITHVGDMAELWGPNLSVDRIAQQAETISYELLCHAGNNCKRNGT